MRISKYPLYPFWVVLIVTAFGGSGCETLPDVYYESSVLLEKGTTFSRASKIAIEIDPGVSIKFRNLLAKVEIAAKAAGLNCTTLEDAEYLLFVTTDIHGEPGKGQGHIVFGIKGKAYRLSDRGKKRAIRNEWEGAVGGRKRIEPSNDYGQYFRPPWVDIDVVVAQFVAAIGVGKINDK